MVQSSVLPINARVLKDESPFPPDQLFPLGTQLPEAVDKNLIYDTYERWIIAR